MKTKEKDLRAFVGEKDELLKRYGPWKGKSYYIVYGTGVKFLVQANSKEHALKIVEYTFIHREDELTVEKANFKMILNLFHFVDSVTDPIRCD